MSISRTDSSAPVDVEGEADRYGDLVQQRVNVQYVIDYTGNTGPDLSSGDIVGQGIETARLDAARGQLDNDEVAELVAVYPEFMFMGVLEESNNLDDSPGWFRVECELYIEEALDLAVNGRNRTFNRQNPVAKGGFGTSSGSTDIINSMTGQQGNDGTFVTIPESEPSVLKWGGQYSTHYYDSNATPPQGSSGGGTHTTGVGEVHNLRDEYGRGPFFDNSLRGQQNTGHDITIGNQLISQNVENVKIYWKYGLQVMWDVMEYTDQQPQRLRLRES